MAETNRRLDGTFFAWDSTMLKSAEKCPRYFQYKMIEGWQPHRKSVHLLFGGHYAKALERYHRWRAEGLDLDSALESVVLLALTETWEIVGSKDGVPIGKPWDSMDNSKTRETLIRSIIWYIDEFAEDSLKTVILPDGKAAAELSFTLAVDDDILFCGHLDRLCDNGDIYIADNKTTSSVITQRFFDQFSPDTQFSLYTFAGQAIYNIPIAGVVIDAAQILVGGTKFDRGFSFRTKEQLDEWYDGAMDLINIINKYISADEPLPMNASSCGNYGGCEFRAVCSKSPSQRKPFLKADFTQGVAWNPLERR